MVGFPGRSLWYTGQQQAGAAARVTALRHRDSAAHRAEATEWRGLNVAIPTPDGRQPRGAARL